MANKSRSSLYATSSREAAPRLTQYSLLDASKSNGIFSSHAFDIIYAMENELLENELTREIIGCAIEVHKTLGGPGCLEKVYQRALAYELVQKGHDVVMEAECPIVYKGHDISEPNHPLRIDILVDNRIIVECKSVTQLNPVFYSQCLTYLRLKNLKVGLVINFGHSHLVTGVKRIVNNGLDKPDAADVDASMQFIDQV